MEANRYRQAMRQWTRAGFKAVVFFRRGKGQNGVLISAFYNAEESLVLMMEREFLICMSRSAEIATCSS